MSPQVPESATNTYDPILDDESGPEISTPAQACTALRSQSIDDSPGDGLGDVTPENPPIDSGDGAMQSGEAGHRVDPDFSTPKGAPTVTTDSVDSRDRVVQPGGAQSTSFFQGSSNVKITDSTFYEIRGNATINRFGNGQFTDVQRKLICDYIANLAVLPDINTNLKEHVLTQSITSLPRAKAMFDDYRNKKKTGPCFKGTREALLREMADWVTSSSESRMYVLSGLAGIGKSTVAYTIASRAADLNLLGASFFFSRDEADRRSAEFFFTTITYQLCVFNETFSKAIGDALLTKRGSAATTKDPRDQLQALILEPLRSIVQPNSRPILIVVDALDECDEEDAFSILTGLSQLVRDLPSFKIILTTRPQPHPNDFLICRDSHKIFRLQDIEDKIVNGDIKLYLNYSLSLQQVQNRNPKWQWCASDEEIESLVRMVGRLFIIASTAVRYILDKSASNPAAQMQKLLLASIRNRTPFKHLNHFYTVILRNVIPEDCDNDDTVSRYQVVVGAIICVQRPLPVSTLAHLININVLEIREVLDNLQSVILLGSDDVPHTYHKSFPDYLTDQTHCKDPRLQIDTRIHHTQIATRCFEIMVKHLKRNILGLGDPARFMSNDDGLKADGITDEQIQEKISQQLRYACEYWVNHLGVVNMEDEALTNGLERFANRCILYWLEVLSLIGRLDLAHRAIDSVLKLPMSPSSDLHQLLSDTLRFISKFYEIIKRSALHTYYSALPFTPTNSLLYHRYITNSAHKICSIQGGPEKWDALVANLKHHDGEKIDVVKFSLDSTRLVSCSEKNVYNNNQGKLKIWDATTGTPISTISGHVFALANDFSTVASSQDNTATLYNVHGSPNGTVFTTKGKIERLALSSESSRVAAVSSRAVWLWDGGNAELIGRFRDYYGGSYQPQLNFSSTGTRLAYSSGNSITLRDGITGRFIADLQHGSLLFYSFQFSGDGSRIASLSPSLRLWNSESGGLIASVEVLGQDPHMAISMNGSLLATAVKKSKVILWSDSLAKNNVLEVNSGFSMAFLLDNILAIADISHVKLYNFCTHFVVLMFPFNDMDHHPIPPAFSPDCTRLAVVGNNHANLWDPRDVNASGPLLKGNATTVTALTLSQDCSRLACGFADGTIELWGTSPTSFTKRQISPRTLRSKMENLFISSFRQFRHATSVRTLGFDPDGRLFASGSCEGTVKLWNSGDGLLRGTLEAPSGLQAVSLSNSMLVAIWHLRYYQFGLHGCGVTLWSLDTLRPIHVVLNESGEPGDTAFKVSIAENSSLIAACFGHSHVTLFNVVNHTIIGIFDVPFHIHTITFLPNNLHLVIQSNGGLFRSLDAINNRMIENPTLEHLIRLPNTLFGHGIPIWHCEDDGQHYFSALFSQQKSLVPVLWIPKQIHVKTWAQGSSMIALGCEDGRVILLRLSTSHIS